MLLLLLIPLVSGFQILSQFSNVYVNGNGDDTLSVNNTMTVRCSLTDYGTTQTFEVVNLLNNNTRHQVRVTCGIPKHYFTFKQIGVVPHNGTLVTSQACEQRLYASGSSDPNNLLSGQPAKIIVNHGSRRLLQFAVGFLGGIVGGLVSQWTCKIPYIGGGCGPDISGFKEAITDLQTGLSDVKNTTNDLRKQILNETAARIALNNQVSKEFQLLNQSLVDTLRAVSTLGTQVNGAIDQANINSDEIQSVLSKMSDFHKSTTNALIKLSSDTSLLKQQVAGLSGVGSEIKSIVSNVTSLFDIMQANQQSTNIHLMDNTRQARDTALRILDYIRDVIGIIQDVRQRTSARRILTRSILDSITFVLPTLGMQPFLIDQGTRGNTDGLWYLVVERFHVNRFISVSTLIVAQEIVYTFRCRVDVVIERLTGWSTVRDFLQRTGPANCSVANLTCMCYMSVDSYICQPSSPSASSPWLVSQGQLLSTSCVGNSTPSVTQSVVTTSTAFYAQLKGDCLVPTFNSSYPYVYVHTDRLGMVMKSRSDTSRCTDDPVALAQSYGDGTFSAAQAIIQMFPIAVSKSRDVFGRVLDTYDGIIPGDLTFKDIPFTIEEGEQASCLEAAYMAFDGKLLPLVAMEFSHSQVDVTVVVDGAPLVVSDVTLTDSVEVGIPGGSLSVGWPNNTATVYDIDSSDLSTSPMESAQRGKVTYNAAQSAALWSPTAWKTRMGLRYDHYSGSNVAGLYERSVVTAGCLGGKLTEGSWCSRLERWTVVPDGPGRVAFEPKTDNSYIVTLDIPQGQIFSQKFPACPTISVDGSNPLGKTLSLTNRQTTPMDVTVLVRGGCVRNYNNVRIDPNTVHHIFIPACDNPNLQHQDVAVYYWNSAGEPSTQPCGNRRYDVTTDYDVNIAQPYSLADTGYVKSSIVLTQDAASLALAGVMQSVTQYMASLALAQLQMMIDMGLPLNASMVLKYKDVVLQHGLSPEEIANITAQYRTDYNLTQDALDYAARIAAQRLINDRNRNATAAALDQARQSVDAAGDGLKILRTLTEEANLAKQRLADATDKYLMSQLNFSGMLVGSLKTLSEELGQDDPGGFLGYILDGFGKAVLGCTKGDGLCGKAASFIEDVAGAVVKLVELPFKIFGGISDFLFQLALTVAISAVVSVAVFKLMEYRRARQEAIAQSPLYQPSKST